MSAQKKIGGRETALRPEDVFTEGEMLLFNNFMKVVDRSPILDPTVDGHNSDFFSVRGGGIEISRDGMLKIRKLANYNVEVKAVNSIEHGNDLHVTVIGRVADASGYVEEVGGCSWSEIAPRKSSKDLRVYNDVVTRAATRMEKRAVEVKISVPFINTLIQMLFGGFQIGEAKGEGRAVAAPPPRAALPSPTTQDDGYQSFLTFLRARRDEKRIQPAELGRYWNTVGGMVKKGVSKEEVVAYIDGVKNEISSRR